MTKEEKKRYVIKNTLSREEMEDTERRFIKGNNPLLNLAEAIKQAKKEDLAKSA